MPEQAEQAHCSDPLSASSDEADALLDRSHTILERPRMLFRPYGVDGRGQKIADVSGTLVVSSLQQLESCLAKRLDPDDCEAVVVQLCELLNERIADPAYHVTPAFLRKEWNSYSYEFLSYLREFCRQLSGDDRFHFNTGLNKVISPVFQILARAFSLSQFARLAVYWSQRYTHGTVECSVSDVTDRSMRFRLAFTERALAQFGPYRKACVYQVCESTRGRMVAAPTLVHGSTPAVVTDVQCVVKGDPCCEWDVRWKPEPSRHQGALWAIVPVIAACTYLTQVYPDVSLWEAALVALVPMLVGSLIMEWRSRALCTRQQELIGEQMRFVDIRYEELRDAYVEQEQTRVELRRKVHQLTVLNRAGIAFNAAFDRETLIDTALRTLIADLGYGRAMIQFYDPVREVLTGGRTYGVPDEIARFVREREFSVADPIGFPNVELRAGKPVLIDDISSIWHRLHPSNKRLVELSGAKALIWIPLMANGRVLGTLTVDRPVPLSVSPEDVDVMVTIGNQLATALDKTTAYQQIEQINNTLEAKVQQRTADLERADRVRAQFLSHVSHELRTPLTSIKGFVENLLDGVTGPTTVKQGGYLGRISDNVNRLIRMINDLLDRTRIEAGQLALTPAELDIEHCLSEVVEQLRPLADEKHVVLKTAFPALPLVVWGDRDRLVQVFTNLVHNAIKFTPSAGTVGVYVSEQPAGRVRIAVCDTGVGMAPDVLDKIFDPFFRTAQSQRSGSKGLGLGLAIVKTLVGLHNGDIAVRSEVGQGTEFIVDLPVYVTLSPTVSADADGRSILVVDDDPDIRQLLVDRLTAHGYDVQVAGTGAEALDAIGTQRFAGVLLDIGLPVVDGLEVLRQVRRNNQHLPIVIATAAESKDLAVRSIGLGAQAYLLKPFSPRELDAVVSDWFGRSHAARSVDEPVPHAPRPV
ncbi:MAG: ATP-binding protein [Nitrospiraceae bacterium]